MTRSRSFTSATLDASDPSSSANPTISATTWWRVLLIATILLGASLRLLRLSWQPLWWDEGYSIFFATEPLQEMFRLTALDIHPPLYYTLLHFWFVLAGSTSPETARLLSVVIGVATLPVLTWTCQTILPTKRWIAFVATLLLAISPIHLYYSQEVRMYGLAMLLTLVASAFLWKIQRGLEQDQRPYAPTFAYILTAALALLTLYYTGFLLVAHQLWALVVNRHHGRRIIWYLTAAFLVFLSNMPWWLYAVPKLLVYVNDKVLSDQDQSLAIWNYIARHWLAFFAGHIPASIQSLEMIRQLSITVIALVMIVAILLTRNHKSVVSWLLTLVLIPTAIGFVVNLIYPFFPEGGERLLLPLLPYLILLYAIACIDFSLSNRYLGLFALSVACFAAFIGIYLFYTTPRYIAHDYRPIVTDVVTNSRPNDSVLALFPWQVGYWRAYTPRTADGELLLPQPPPVDQTILRWDDAFAARLNSDLDKGTIWFPMPVSFGSTLPTEIENYLELHARNLENHWYSAATRVTAWVQVADEPQPSPIGLTFADELTLVSSGVAPATVTSANNPIAVDLCWQPATLRDDLRATLRLIDGDGATWASRDLTPLASYASLDPTNPCLEAVAFNIPISLPPNAYHLAIGVGPEGSDQLFKGSTNGLSLTPLAEVTVSPPELAISPLRLPIAHRLSSPLEQDGMLLLGNNGPDSAVPILAGDELSLILYLQAVRAQPVDREIYLTLADRQGKEVASWQTWPLPTYPPHLWANGALAQAPMSFYLPPTLAEGEYSLSAGFYDTVRGVRGESASLATVQIVRRPITYEIPTLQYQVAPTATFGTHANLIGYDLSQAGNTLELSLTWQVLQTLLPPHHIFVHLLDTEGQRIAQSDAEPMTAVGRAPTGSWNAGEIITTEQLLTLPPGLQSTPITIQVGLYLPTSGVRLPVTVDGATIGDSVILTTTYVVTP